MPRSSLSMSEGQKCALLQKIYEEREVYHVGKLTPGCRHATIEAAWSTLWDWCAENNYPFIGHPKKAEHLRYSVWRANLKKNFTKRLATEAKSGGAGAKALSLSDQWMLMIFGRDSASIKGLGVPSTWASADSTVAKIGRNIASQSGQSSSSSQSQRNVAPHVAGIENEHQDEAPDTEDLATAAQRDMPPMPVDPPMPPTQPLQLKPILKSKFKATSERRRDRDEYATSSAAVRDDYEARMREKREVLIDLQIQKAKLELKALQKKMAAGRPFSVSRAVDLVDEGDSVINRVVKFERAAEAEETDAEGEEEPVGGKGDKHAADDMNTD